MQGNFFDRKFCHRCREPFTEHSGATLCPTCWMMSHRKADREEYWKGFKKEDEDGKKENQ